MKITNVEKEPQILNTLDKFKDVKSVVAESIREANLINRISKNSNDSNTAK